MERNLSSYEKNLLHEVHRFFHGMFRDQSDRSHMLEMITNGGFFAIVNPDHQKPVVIAAISYIRREHEFIITYFGTKLILRSLGLGQMLLILVEKHSLHLYMKNVTMYLTANAKDNQFSTKWYTKRGFSMTRQHDENWVRFSKLLEGLPETYDDDSLELFVLKIFATKFKFPHCAVGQPLSRLYTYPFHEGPSSPIREHIYAVFPNNFPLEACDHCTDGKKVLDVSVFRTETNVPKTFLTATQ